MIEFVYNTGLMARERVIPWSTNPAEPVQQTNPRPRQEIGQVFDGYFSRVYGYHLHNGGNDSLAQRATEATFNRINVGLPTFDSQTSLDTWVFRIAYGEAQQAQGARTVPVYDSKPITVAENIIRETFGLPDEERHIILLRFTGGLTFDQIADIMGKDPKYIEEQAKNTLQGIKEKLGL